MPAFFVASMAIRRIVARFAMPGMYPYARIVVRRAQAKAPVRTGRLKSRIRIVPTTNSLRIVTDAENDGFKYAALQERRRPYLRPAIRK